MSDFTIFHNPRCRKSRETLQILEEAGVDPEVVHYLEDPLEETMLAEICEILGVRPHRIVRKREARDLDLDIDSMSDDEVLTAIENHPILMERPIVIKDDMEAVLGRPPENVRELL